MFARVCGEEASLGQIKKGRHRTPKQPNTKQAVKPPPFNPYESALTCSGPLIHLFSFTLSPSFHSSVLTSLPCRREKVVLYTFWRRDVEVVLVLLKYTLYVQQVGGSLCVCMRQNVTVWDILIDVNTVYSVAVTVTQ